MTLLEKEPVKRAEKSLKEFDKSLSIVELESSAKTALEACLLYTSPSPRD